MSLPHAILGFLQIVPMTGYYLKTVAFDQSVAHFWPAVLPQIYRELDRMEGWGWVESEVEIQEGKPNRKVFTITAGGEEELERWLREYQPPPAHREAFLVQLFFGAQLSNEEIIALLEDQRRAHEERLAELGKIQPIHDPEGTPEHRRQKLMWLTLDFGKRMEQTYIDWINDAVEAVRNL